MSSQPPSREKYHALLASASKTAGCDNWKTVAGRKNGPDGFVVGDAWRLLKLNLKWSSSSRPSVCPVCLDKPSSDDEWYVTKSCRHAVCRDCLQSYALSLISDANHTGPLKCPCCPRLLRAEDAKVALSAGIPKAAVTKRRLSKRCIENGLFADPENTHDTNNSALEVLQRWDNKTRNEFLRAMTDFRPCPHCSESCRNDTVDSSRDEDNIMNQGGGFVTPECLAPIHEERESNAECLLNLAGTSTSIAVLLMYSIYYIYCGSSETNNPALQIISAILPSMIMPMFTHALRLFIATIARREVVRPIIVTCPCCLQSFNLEASSELQIPDTTTSSGNAAETATQHWKNTNTRPCPTCGSPIMKDGGCNHVKCGRCKADFCWACMKSRTSCRPYRCSNGARFGNAFGDGSMAAVREGLAVLERERQGRTLIERIDHVEADALRNLRLFRTSPFRYVSFIGVACIIVSCLTNPRSIAAAVWSAVKGIVSLAASLLFSSLRALGVLALVAFIANIGAQGRGAGGARGGQQRNGTRGIRRLPNNNNRRSRRSLSFRRAGFVGTEEEQLAEVIARSLEEQ